MTPVSCKYWKPEGTEHGVCEVASVIADRDASIPENACGICMKQSRPMQLNRVTVSLAMRVFSGDRATQNQLYLEHFKWLQLSGPGTELYYLIHDAGYELRRGCPCISTIVRMNRLGPDWCLGKGREEILDSLLEEFAIRHPIVSELMPVAILESKINSWLEIAVRNFLAYQGAKPV